ncbi:hypothetical protein STEG23_032075 [Scotinomys teguina]
MWNNTAEDDRQPYEKKAAKEGKTQKRISLPTELKENQMRLGRGWSEQEKEEEDEEDKEDEEDEEDDDDDDDDDE